MKAGYSFVLIMGVAGSGKTTVGQLLACELGWPYFEADDFHPAANVEKMARGEPLSDEDRAPWLARIRARLDECVAHGARGVFTCSALKQAYRDILLAELRGVLLVHLEADRAIIDARVAERKAHFMKSNMVESQFAALESPTDALTLDARRPPGELVRLIIASLNQ